MLTLAKARYSYDKRQTKGHDCPCLTLSTGALTDSRQSEMNKSRLFYEASILTKMKEKQKPFEEPITTFGDRAQKTLIDFFSHNASEEISAERQEHKRNPSFHHTKIDIES